MAQACPREGIGKTDMWKPATILLSMFILTATPLLSGCENTGEHFEDIGDEAGDAVEDAGDAIEDATDELQ